MGPNRSSDHVPVKASERVLLERQPINREIPRIVDGQGLRADHAGTGLDHVDVGPIELDRAFILSNPAGCGGEDQQEAQDNLHANRRRTRGESFAREEPIEYR